MSPAGPGPDGPGDPTMEDALVTAGAVMHFITENPGRIFAFARWAEHCPGDLDADMVVSFLAACHDLLAPDCGDKITMPGPPAPLTATERRVWSAWAGLPDDEPSPVKRIAAQLGMSAADVAFIVYPAEKYGPWADDQEPELP